MAIRGTRPPAPHLSRLLVLGLAVVLVLAAPPARAASISLLRDPDIENGLAMMAFPILRAAGLSSRRTQLLVVDDQRMNAFVLDNRAIFVNAGLVQKVTRPEMLQAVLAHEAAHIANGHISRRMSNLDSAGTAAGLGTLLALIAAAAGAGEAAGGIAMGTTSSAFRSFLAHTRAEESAADRSAASYLRWAGIDVGGLVDLHRAFEGQELISVSRQDPYTQSHPLSADRIRAAERLAAAQPEVPATRDDTAYWFARTRGKLSAFTRAPAWTLRRAPAEPHADVRHMREAVAHHRNHDRVRALASIDAALSLRPDDPFYYELKGQILLEHRQVSAAVAAYERAVELAPDNALILAAHGRALLAAGRPGDALAALEKSRSRDFRNAMVMHDLSRAYAQSDQLGMAALLTAERYALQGRMPDAGINARRAMGLLPRGSGPWQRAQDVVIAVERQDKKKRKKK
ncbi:M48 family metalloprotease [Pukyongiella litopenaei]|uniref:M48 family metalloprotease n=1 Tax=Pukyongiella litopenaei TaxID=2605946 RepID=A0A2S0MTG7_9RHOB|nr:M48 family metalloprotease [Pukyongiella litopenaei]AVO39097.1 M48 family metalloprotease [Pukyongiella litopenaei]